MTAKEILAFITEVGIVPVVRTTSAEQAIQAVEACYNGGVRAAEITMTVPGAVRALEKVADRFGDNIMLGAGTVLDPETAREIQRRKFAATSTAGVFFDGRTRAIAIMIFAETVRSNRQSQRY